MGILDLTELGSGIVDDLHHVIEKSYIMAPGIGRATPPLLLLTRQQVDRLNEFSKPSQHIAYEEVGETENGQTINKAVYKNDIQIFDLCPIKVIED